MPRAKPKEVVVRLAGMLRPRTFVEIVRSFYADRIGLVGALSCAVVLTYVGGAAMLWYHSFYLGEGGPGISPWVHWALDSTAGFFGLTLPILLIIPVAAAATSSAEDAPQVTLPLFATITGTLLAVVTAPGPLIHDEFIGRGTWMAARVTDWFGNGHHATGQPQDLSIPLRMVQQIAAGTPIYIALTLISVSAIRRIHRVFAG